MPAFTAQPKQAPSSGSTSTATPDTDEIRPQYQTQDAPDANALFASSIVRDTGLSVGASIDQLDTTVTDLYGLNERAIPWYSDQVLPFNLVSSSCLITKPSRAGARNRCRILIEEEKK